MFVTLILPRLGKMIMLIIAEKVQRFLTIEILTYSNFLFSPTFHRPIPDLSRFARISGNPGYFINLLVSCCTVQ